MSGLVAQPGYWRAAAIELLQPLPLGTLFGPHGEAVVDILARIPELTREQAQALGAHLPADGWDRYGRAWERWAAVSYTHLDVYKRQARAWLPAAAGCGSGSRRH